MSLECTTLFDWHCVDFILQALKNLFWFSQFTILQIPAHFSKLHFSKLTKIDAVWCCNHSNSERVVTQYACNYTASIMSFLWGHLYGQVMWMNKAVTNWRKVQFPAFLRVKSASFTGAHLIVYMGLVKLRTVVVLFNALGATQVMLYMTCRQTAGNCEPSLSITLVTLNTVWSDKCEVWREDINSENIGLRTLCGHSFRFPLCVWQELLCKPYTVFLQDVSGTYS